MAHRRDFRRGAAAIAQSRLTTWAFITPVATTLATNTTAVLVSSLNAAALALRPFTIVRMHLEVFMRSDQSAAVEAQAASIGAAVVSDQSVAIGVTAVPTPTTDAASDKWFLHKFLFGNSVSLTDQTVPGVRYTLDSKAMRKVDGGSDLIWVVEGGGIEAGSMVTFGGRFLIKTN